MTVSIKNRTIRGIRDNIPKGYVIGRVGVSGGPPQLVKIKDLVRQNQKAGGVAKSYVDAGDAAAIATAEAFATAAVGAIQPNVATLAPGYSGTSTAANASTFGNIFTPTADINVVAASALITTVTSGTYKLGIAPFNTGTGKVTAAPTYTGTFTVGTGAAHKVVSGKFAAPFACTAGTTYILFLVRTDATSSTTLTFDTSGGGAFSYAVFIEPLTNVTKWNIANQAPGTGDTWGVVSGGSTYMIMMLYST